MKRIFISLFFCAIFFALFALGVCADETGQVEYVISDDDGTYLLSAYTDGAVTPVKRSATVSDLVEYINSLNGKVSVFFKEVTLNEDIYLRPQDAYISGNVYLNDEYSFIVEGGNIFADKFSLNMNNGSLVVKDGVFVFESGTITSKAEAVVMSYSASAKVYLKGGKIEGNSSSGTLITEIGSCFIDGCSIYNYSSIAIINKTTLSLSSTADIQGIGYDICTETPITLSGEDAFFASKLNVKYDRIFEKGSLNCVFYSASASLLSNVSLFDADGIEQPLSYFESHESTREKKFGAVYLPYKITFYADGIAVSIKESVGGGDISEISAPNKNGYEFLGWTLEDDSDILYDFAEKISSDVSLYAKYRLTPPSFALSSLSFTYDGREHNFGITSIQHPLLPFAIINYEWFRNGELISSSGSEMKLSRVSESGEYFCTITFSVGTDTVKVSTPTAVVNISKVVIDLPHPPEKSYNGEYQSSDIPSTSFYTVENAGGTLSGVYPVQLTLIDSENCEFNGGGSTAVIDFKIVRAENFWIEELRSYDIYQGMEPSNSAIARFGEVVYVYSDKYEGPYISIPPTLPGEYYCKAFVEGDENYSELFSEPSKFSLIEERVIGISILSMPDKCEYTAFDTFVANGLTVSATYNSSRIEIVGVDKITFSYQSAENLRYGDTAVIATYVGASVVVPVTVKKAEYDISAITFESDTRIYNGTRQSLNYGGVIPVGLDGIQLSASLSGGGVGVGEYSVFLVFSTTSKNYKIPEPIEKKITIAPYESRVIFSELSFIYSGKEVCPSAYCLDIYGRKMDLSVDGARSLAGEYIARAYIEDPNYLLLDDSIKFNILKADYDFSGVGWTYENFVYDGKEKSVFVNGLPDGVSAIGYSDNKAISAGIYTARAALMYDERNYNKPPELSFNWEIARAEYDTSVFCFSDTEYIYDGSVHYPQCHGEMPIGVDGIALQYDFSSGALHVSDGRVGVQISFYTESENYVAPAAIVAFVEILPLEITVEWQNTEFIYDSSPHAPVAISSECSVFVLGAMSDAGYYTATAMPASSDFSIINPSIDFIIEKANNFWISELEIESVFEGRVPSPNAACFSGEIVYAYYSDSGEKLDFIPDIPGKYFVQAYSEGSQNYKPIRSHLAEFEIIAITPVSIDVEALKSEYSAFERVSDRDITVTLFNNDGSVSQVAFEMLVISYENGDSFRFADESVVISCFGFNEAIKVSVKKADYDFNNVLWSDDTFVYDGTEKNVSITGLPQGISVKEYIGGNATDSGEYVAEAIMIYDSENYNPPPQIKHVWKIEKQYVTVPKTEALEYNGFEQKALILPSDIYTVSMTSGINAGRYPIILTLRDSENYTFGSNGQHVEIFYEILPREITVKVFDVDKYLFSDIPKPEYEIVDGEVVNGDEIRLSFDYSENEVYCVSENPNYSVRVIPGNIIRHNTLADDAFFKLFVTFAIVVLLILATVIIIRKRRRLVHCMSALKCKLSPIENSGEKDVNKVESSKNDEEKAEKEDIEQSLSVDAASADRLISDSLAKNLLRKNDERLESDGRKRRIINVDTLSDNFNAGDRIDVNILKQRNLIAQDTVYIKVLARGVINKPLKIYANDFSLSAVKMIALSGGEAVKVITVRKRNGKGKK